MTGNSEEEAAWRDLVAHYAATTAQQEPAPWPPQEDITGVSADDDTGDLPAATGDDTPGGAPQPGPPDEPPADDTPVTGAPDPVPGVIPSPPRIRVVRPSAAVPPSAWREHVPWDEVDEGHYVPPEPPPLPHLDPAAKMAWAAVLGGPGYLLVAVLAHWPVPGWAAFCAVGAFMAGFATLVVRMGDRPPGDSGPDDGAVV